MSQNASAPDLSGNSVEGDTNPQVMEEGNTMIAEIDPDVAAVFAAIGAARNGYVDLEPGSRFAQDLGEEVRQDAGDTHVGQRTQLIAVYGPDGTKSTAQPWAALEAQLGRAWATVFYGTANMAVRVDDLLLVSGGEWACVVIEDGVHVFVTVEEFARRQEAAFLANPDEERPSWRSVKASYFDPTFGVDDLGAMFWESADLTGDQEGVDLHLSRVDCAETDGSVTTGVTSFVVVFGDRDVEFRSLDELRAVVDALSVAVDRAEVLVTPDPPLSAEAAMGARNLAAMMRERGAANLGELFGMQRADGPEAVQP